MVFYIFHLSPSKFPSNYLLLLNTFIHKRKRSRLNVINASELSPFAITVPLARWRQFDTQFSVDYGDTFSNDTRISMRKKPRQSARENEQKNEAIRSHVRPLHRSIRKSNKKKKNRLDAWAVSTSGVAVFQSGLPIGWPRENCSAGWFFFWRKNRAGCSNR